MKDLYVFEVRKELARYSNHPNEVITENDIASLPEPVQKYFRHCGYLGKQKMDNALIKWENVFLKMSPGRKWMRLQCCQFNSVPEPTRIVYMKSKIMGMLPFEGRDKYQDGNGNMLIKLLKFIRVADAKSKQMDESALVTVLAESLLVPTYALQRYIKWKAVDTNTANAEIEHNNSKASGLFHFNDKGEFVKFETQDRYYSEKGTDYKKLKWSVLAGEYMKKNGIRFPSCLKAMWDMKEGNFEYFKGNITNIEFNINGL